MWFISVTADTSHPPISPCGSAEQSPSGAIFRQIVTASLSSDLDRGENAVLGVMVISRMDSQTLANARASRKPRLPARDEIEFSSDDSSSLLHSDHFIPGAIDMVDAVVVVVVGSRG